MNFGELQTAMLDDLSLLSTDTFYTTGLIKRYLNRSVKYIAGKHNWQQTQKAKTATITESQVGEYFNYGEDFKQDSLFRIEVNGKKYKIVTFPEFREFKTDNPNNSTKLASDFRNRIFANPSFASGDTVD